MQSDSEMPSTDPYAGGLFCTKDKVKIIRVNNKNKQNVNKSKSVAQAVSVGRTITKHLLPQARSCGKY